MPRASWRGFLRLSLVSCPIYLSPATSRTKSIRLRQVWRPAAEDEVEDEAPEAARLKQVTEPSLPDLGGHDGGYDADQTQPVTRVTIRPHDPRTGEEIDKAEVVKGYEFGRGQFVTFTPEELKALDVESSKVIDLEKFVPRGDLDPVYLDTPYYLYPEGPVAEQTLGVIGAAMPRPASSGSGLSRSAGASGWSRSSLAAPAWRSSRCALRTRSGRRSSVASREISTLTWSRSLARSSVSGPEVSIRRRIETATRRHCAS